MDWRTDKVSYRVACTRSRIKGFSQNQCQYFLAHPIGIANHLRDERKYVQCIPCMRETKQGAIKHDCIEIQESPKGKRPRLENTIIYSIKYMIYIVYSIVYMYIVFRSENSTKQWRTYERTIRTNEWTNGPI